MQKKTRQILIDNETLDVTPSAVLLTIGAVAVEIENGQAIVLASWYRRLRWRASENQQRNRTASQNTADWWAAQPIDTQVEALEDDGSRIPLQLAMHSLQAWLSLHPYPIWGNGSDFDNAQLQHAFIQNGLCWPYWRNRCLRSLNGLVLDLYPNTQIPAFPAGKTKHHALHDAEYEATVLAVLLHALDSQQDVLRTDDFVRLFHSPSYGQIAILRDHDEDDQPEIRALTQPNGLGICQAAISFTDSDAGEMQRDKLFAKFTQQQAEHLVRGLHEWAGKLTNEDAA